MGVLLLPLFFFYRTEGASLADEDLVRPPTDSACDYPAPPASCMRLSRSASRRRRSARCARSRYFLRNGAAMSEVRTLSWPRAAPSALSVDVRWLHEIAVLAASLAGHNGPSCRIEGRVRSRHFGVRESRVDKARQFPSLFSARLFAMSQTAPRITAKGKEKTMHLSDQGLIVILVVGLIAG
jgi:hypothetical protein